MFKRLKTIDKVLLAKHLSLMLSAGVPLRQSIHELRDQADSKYLQKILKNLEQGVQRGQSISSMLNEYKNEFGSLFINMVKVGEESGTLETSLNHLADQLEASYALKKKVKGAMMYPVLVFGATMTIGFGLAIFVLPKLLTFFKGLNFKLPLMTRILLAVVGNLEKFGVYYIGGMILFIIAFRFLLRLKKFKLVFHRILLEMPIFGKLIKKLNLAYFSRTLATLLKSGVTIVEALDISAATLSNSAYRNTLEQASGKVREGQGLSDFLKETSHLIPGMVSKVIEVGEKSGQLEQTLFYIADFYEKDVDSATKNLANILEPILLIGVGLVVGVVAISILMPIYQFTSAIQGGNF